MVVSRTTTNTASSVNSLLEDRDIGGLFAVAAGSAGGVIITQRIANRVLPAVGLSPTPNTLLEGGASAGLKTAVAAVFMYAALQTRGIAKTILAFLSVGSLTSAGFDLISLFFDVPQLAQANSATAVTSPRQTARRVKSVSASSGNRSTSTSNNHNEVEFRSTNGMAEEQFR